MDQDTVNPIEEIVESAVSAEELVEDVASNEESREQTQVPLFALKKEREKRKELELENRWLKEQQMARAQPEPPPVDDSIYESATKADLNKKELEIFRGIEERAWMRANPEKVEKINQRLAEFLKTRQHLALAIEAAPNRYEEAYELMDKLSPREQKQLKAAVAPKKEAPGSPNGSPKAAVLNEAVDFMSMTDAQYDAWVRSKVKAR